MTLDDEIEDVLAASRREKLPDALVTSPQIASGSVTTAHFAELDAETRAAIGRMLEPGMIAIQIRLRREYLRAVRMEHWRRSALAVIAGAVVGLVVGLTVGGALWLAFGG